MALPWLIFDHFCIVRDVILHRFKDTGWSALLKCASDLSALAVRSYDRSLVNSLKYDMLKPREFEATCAIMINYVQFPNFLLDDLRRHETSVKMQRIRIEDT